MTLPSSSPPLNALDDDLSFSDLSLLTTPQPNRKFAVRRSAQTSGRPSTTHHASSSSPPLPSSPLKRRDESQLRLLQGVKANAGRATAEKAAGGPPVTKPRLGKARPSLFGPSALPSSEPPVASSSEQAQDDDEEEEEGVEEHGADGHDHAQGRGALTPPPVSQTNTQRASNDLRSSLGVLKAAGGTTETKEQMQRQLDQLAKMNSTFEGFERMLQGTEGQLDVSIPGCARIIKSVSDIPSTQLFTQRLGSTSSLLSSYIDLLLRASDHQTLLLDPQWQGQRLDEQKHVEAMRELEEELERRRRRREQEEREAEQRRQEQEQERARRLVSAAAVGPDGRRRTVSSGAGRGTAARGRGGIATRGARPPASGASAMSGRTRTSSTGAVGRPSGIQPPSSVRGVRGTGLAGGRGRGG